jgi:hypothetical protein
VPTLVVSALSTFDNKGLKKAKKEVSTFEKQIKSFAKVFAAAFSVSALTNYSKKAVQAFMADEKAAKSLEQQLKNTGYQFSAPGVELYIANLQKATGVLDDDLRPAFQQLLTVTGSITKSQDALSTALNVSAATGRSLGEVTTALSRGFAGNTTGLSRLGAGLSKTLLKTNDMNLIMGELNKKFAGQSAARLTTYAGKMDLLKVASENVKEEIGKGILGALDALGKDTNIEDTSKKMQALGKQTGYTITGLGVLIAKLGDIPGIGLIGKAFYETSALGLLARLGKENTPARELPANEQRSAGRIDAKRFQTEDKLAKAKAAELALLLKKNAIDNKNVEELKKKFDLERIGLNAALNSATDEETKLRLKAQLAILDNNEALAKKLIAELEAAEALKKLADQAKLAGMSLEDFALFKVKTLNTKIDDYLQSTALEMVRALNAQIAAFIASMGGVTKTSSTTTSTPTFTPSPASYFQDLATQLVGTSSYAGMNVSQIATERARESGNRSVDVNVRIDSPSGDKFAQLVAESIQVAGRTGFSTAPNGGLPG